MKKWFWNIAMKKSMILCYKKISFTRKKLNYIATKRFKYLIKKKQEMLEIALSKKLRLNCWKINKII